MEDSLLAAFSPQAVAVKKAIELIPGLIDSGIKIWEIKRDGTYFQQRRFQALLDEEAAQAAQERALERSELEAALRSHAQEHAHKLDMARDWHQARITVQLREEAEQRARKLSTSPFRLSPEDVRHHVKSATCEGKIPALLIAPFFQDNLGRKENDEGPSRFLVALRRSWDRMKWRDDLVPRAGLIDRPLRNMDLDVQTIREVLHDLPVVLVFGEVQAGRRVHLGLCAWNILGEAIGGSALHLSVPGLSLPDLSAENADLSTDAALAFEDALGEFCGIMAGALGEWFHLTRHGRTPQLHRQLPEAMVTERRILASSAAALYGLAVQYKKVDSVSASVGRAELYAETGQGELAKEFGTQAIAALRTNPDLAHASPELLIRLSRVFEIVGDEKARRDLCAWYVDLVWH